MVTLYVLVGLPGSGKSTYAKELSERTGAVIHSTDAIREELYGTRKFGNNSEVFNLVRKRVLDSLSNGYDVIYDATNISVKSRSRVLNALLNVICYRVAVVIDRDAKTCIEQNKLRIKEHQVPNVAIYTLNSKYEEPTEREKFDSILRV